MDAFPTHQAQSVLTLESENAFWMLTHISNPCVVDYRFAGPKLSNAQARLSSSSPRVLSPCGMSERINVFAGLGSADFHNEAEEGSAGRQRKRSRASPRRILSWVGKHQRLRKSRVANAAFIRRAPISNSILKRRRRPSSVWLENGRRATLCELLETSSRCFGGGQGV